MTKDLSTLTEMLNLLIESSETLSHGDDENELQLSEQISRLIPAATQMVMRMTTSRIRQMEAVLETATGGRQERPDDEDLAELSGAQIGRKEGLG